MTICSRCDYLIRWFDAEADPVEREETTLLSPTNQPTNQPVRPGPLPDTYISIRLTLDHKFRRTLINELIEIPDVCIYEHKRGTSNEHFHICLPGGIDANRIEKYRKRLRTKFGGSGNKLLSAKGYSNGCRSFVFYCGHENRNPIFEDPRWREVIDSVENEGYFVKQTRVDSWAKPAEKKDRDWQLTYSNLVPTALHHRQKNNLQLESLRAVCKHMFEHTRWRPSNQMYKCGVTDNYQNDFEFRIGKRPDFDMSWWTPKNL